MKKYTLFASMAIIIVASIFVGAGTMAYFSDLETSTGNVFTAGTIDISIDPSGGQDVATMSGDLDLKPSQTGWTTTLITNDGTNPVEIWKHITNVVNVEHGTNDAELDFYADHPGSDNWLISDWIHYDMNVIKEIGFSWSGTTGEQTVNIDVEDGDGQVTWTIDFPGEAPYDDPTTEGNGHWTVGLIIAMNGDGNGPAYQIHNTDSDQMTLSDGTPLVAGTWVMSPWGPTIDDGWFGWHSGYDNTLVTDLDWVSCTGDRYNENNPDGLFTITIDKSELVGDIHWALNLAIGSGFWGTYMTYEQMSYPVGNGFMGTPAFEWDNPVVDMTIPNYEAASISELIKEIPEGAGFFLTGTNGQGGVASQWIYLGALQPEESMIVVQSYHLDASVENWGQSDRVLFDIEYFGQQTEGDPQPPEPTPVLSGQGRP
jgi:predicted ribosomally synthesized peptide with SipW-like signal peptide